MSLIETGPRRWSPRFFAAEPKIAVLRELKRVGYTFVTPSIATHRRVLRRPDRGVGLNLRDIFGWSLPFEPNALTPRVLDLMRRGGLVREEGDLLRSTVRVSSLGDDLFLHSAFPPSAPDSVFFGPDTYRFASFLREELRRAPAGGVVVDVGAGSGAGAVTVARCAAPAHLLLLDVNPRALDLARANLGAANLDGEFVLSDGLTGFSRRADLIVANPPFIAGTDGQAYKAGGDLHGCRLSLEWAVTSVEKLNPGGRLLLYTGSAIVDGRDPFLATLKERLSDYDVEVAYRELDPDIFGGMLSSEAYVDVDRIAAVGLSVTRRQ